MDCLDASCGNKKTQRAADGIGFGMTKYALAGGIDRGDVPGVIDGHDHVFDVIEHGLELTGGAFAQLAGQRQIASVQLIKALGGGWHEQQIFARNREREMRQ